MSKFDVTTESIVALCIDHDLAEPGEISISDTEIALEYEGNKALDAMRMFDRGLGLLWDYDWTDETTEHSVTVKSDRDGNVSTLSIIRRTV